eukprot:6176679-Pleurochrysis_carterae.AAC.2
MTFESRLQRVDCELTTCAFVFAAIIKGNEAKQCWWSLGYPVAFLAHLHMVTNDSRYLSTAEKMLDFARRCHPDLRASIVSHKVMWGAALVSNLSGGRQHWDLVHDIAGHIIKVGQIADGRVMHWDWQRGTPYGEAQVIDQTCEIAYWFYVTARQMEKSEAARKHA